MAEWESKIPIAQASHVWFCPDCRVLWGGMPGPFTCPRCRYNGDPVEMVERQFEESRPTTSHVYYIGADNSVKIGVSVNPKKRLNRLRSGNPVKLALLATEPGDAVLEALRHKQFEHLRVRGEWFRHEGALAEWIRELQRRGDGLE